MTEDKNCKFCRELIPKYNRKDSVFCSTPCRQAYWEVSGRRKSKLKDYCVSKGFIPKDNSSDGVFMLKTSENKLNVGDGDGERNNSKICE